MEQQKLICEYCHSTESVGCKDAFERTVCAACVGRVNKRIEFVRKCGEVLNMAMPNLVKCELKLGRDIPVNSLMNEHFMPDDEYVLVTCKNGYTYKVLVEANSLTAIAEEIFRNMKNK